MDIYTGKLQALTMADYETAKNMERVPEELEFVARLKLREAADRAAAAGKAQVNLRSSHPLAKWAAKARADKKLRAKIAAASRRRNRK